MALLYAQTPRDVLALTGRDRASFLQGMVTNDVLALTPNKSCYAFHLDATGHVLADMYVLCSEDKLLLITESGIGESLNQSLEHYLVMERVKITPIIYYHYLFLEGFPPSPVRHGGESAAEERGETLRGTAWPMPSTQTLSYLHSLGAGVLTEIPLEVAANYQQLNAAELEVRRIDAGIPTFGVDMDKRVLAPETGQAARAIHYKKGCYVGQEIVARIDARGHTNRTLVRLKLTALVPPETPLTLDGKEVGRVTSSGLTPSGAIALGYLRHEHVEPGTALDNGVLVR